MLPRPDRLQFSVLVLFLAVLWLAGGASRVDELGQSVVRIAATLSLVMAALFGKAPLFRDARATTILLASALGLALAQLIPLPPIWWQSLPGRHVLAAAAIVSGQPQPWRPVAIVPGAAANAAASLVIPAAVLILMLQSGDSARRWLPGVILGLVVASAIFGALQFAGSGLNNPLIGGSSSDVSGPFANRNHFALFLAIGCVVAPVWAFQHRRPGWRGPFALGLVVLFVLMMLGTGSRAGLLLGIAAIGMGCAITRRAIGRTFRRYPRWAVIWGVAGGVVIFAITVLIAIIADRAAAVDRILAVDPAQDMRSRGLATVLAMVREYFPVGAGMGGFDQLFRLHEPFALLEVTYFNHAHNDWLELVLDGGAFTAALLAGAVGWWFWASVAAWRRPSDHSLARLGSAILLLIMSASAVDYPSRTPMIMAIVVIAAVWLGERRPESGRSALPGESHYL